MKIFISGEVDSKVSEIFRSLCKEITDKIKIIEKNDYGKEVVDLGIIPIIVNLTPDIESAGFFKERQYFKKTTGEADFRLRINYEKFLSGNKELQKLLFLNNIIQSIRLLSKKAKDDFNAKKLINDILELFEICEEDLARINFL